MTHEQRIAEIREALLGRWCALSSEGELGGSYEQINKSITSLDTLAAECLRLREDKERLDKCKVWFEEVYQVGNQFCLVREIMEGDAPWEVNNGPEYASLREAIDKAIALDAAKEAK